MPPGRLLVGHRGIPGGGLEPFAVTARLSSGQHNSLDLTIWALAPERRWRSRRKRPAPAWRALRVCAVGTSLLGHDVSGTSRQTVGRMMLSITTMVPV